MPQSVLAGLPRLVRAADELRWRAVGALGLAAATAAFFLISWAIGEPVELARAGLALAAALAPATIVVVLVGGRRVPGALRETRPIPRASVRETLADARDRRSKLAAVVLTGIVALLLFDRLTTGGGVMAALVTGLLSAFGLLDIRDATRLAAAERRRESRLYLLVRPGALSPPVGPIELYELPRSESWREPAAAPFDLSS